MAFLMDIVGIPVIALCLLVLSFFIMDTKQYMIVCFVIIFSGFSSIISLKVNVNEFKVQIIHDSYTVYSSKYQNILAWHQYEGNLDDEVLLSGKLVVADKSTFNAVQRISYVLEKPNVKLIKASNSYRSKLAKKLDSHPKSLQLILNQSIDGLPMVSSLSLQVSGILVIVNYLLNQRDYYFKVGSLDLITIIAYGLIFGFGFSLLRILLAKKFSSEISGLLMLIAFPGSALSFHFLFPYSLTLLKNLSNRFDGISFKALVPFLSLLSQNRFHLIEYLLYPLFKILSGVFTLLLCILPKTGFIIEPILSYMIQILNYRVFKRFELYGSVPLVLIIIILFFYSRNHRRLWQITVFALVFSIVYPPFSRVVFLDVGQGDATLIQAPFGTYNTLIDTGSARSYRKLKKKLHKYNVDTIHQLIITHEDEDHNGNLDSLAKDFNVQNIVTQANDVQFLNVHNLEKEYDDKNANSLIMSLKIKDTNFLFTGDAGTEQENVLLKKYPLIVSDIFKLGHHGSNTSNSKELVKKIKAKYAIASSNPKIYGHPHLDVKKTLYHQRVKLLQTSTDGDIVVLFTLFYDFIHTESKGFAIM